MNEHYPPILEDATADGILAVLQDLYRHDPDADPDMLLSHDTTIAEWREACDLLPWAEIAEGMNAYWSVSISIEQWREVLEPAKQRRLRGVCDLLTRHAKAPRVQPASILGATCISAGAFLTIRSYLAQAGADVRDVAPSTQLHEYTRRHPAVFLERVSQLAPGALPRVKIRAPVRDGFAFGMAGGAIAMIVSLCAGSHMVSLCAGLVGAICYSADWTIGQWVLPASVEFKGLRTFRDLSVAVAAGARK